MALRKFAADYLFTGHQMLGNDAVLITDEVGKVIDITKSEEVNNGIERYNGILCPGFINAHCHLELSHLRGTIPVGLGMVEFLIAVMNTRNIEEQHILNAISAGDQYMREKGIVAVGDICNSVHTISVKNGSDLYYHNFVEALGFVPATASSRFAQALQTYRVFTEHLSAVTITPHASYSVSEKLFKIIADFAKGNLLSIHNQESAAENEFIEKRTGDFLSLYNSLKMDISFFKPQRKSSLQYTLELLNKEHSVILVHNVVTSAKDIEYIKQTNSEKRELWWCLCPNANIYITNKLPNVSLFRNLSDKVIVGTDSLASNTQLNVLEELKTLQQHFSSLSTEELLKWATINGANALKIQSRYGSFDKGKQPGIVIIHGGKDRQLEGTVSRRVL